LTANRIASNKSTPTSLDQAGLGPADIGVNAFAYHPHEPQYTVAGGGGFVVSTQGGPTNTAMFAGSDDLNVIRGNHQFAVGASGAAWWANQYTNANGLQFAFNGQTTGLGMADFLTGNVFAMTSGHPGGQHKRS